MKTTQDQIAKKAGVTRTTVSKVLSGLPDSRISESTRKRIRTIARQLKYKPRVNVQRHTHIGFTVYDLLYVEQSALDTLAIANIVGAMSHYAALRDCCHIEFCSSNIKFDGDGHYFLDRAERGKIDALVIFDSIVKDSTLLQLQKFHVPVILLERKLDGDGFVSICVDHASATKKLAERMVDAGHHHIGLIVTGQTWEQSQSKIRGLKHAQAKRSFRFTVLEQVNPSHHHTGLFDPRAWKNHKEDVLFGNDRCDAFIASNDHTAAHIVRYCMAQGMRVPEDVSVAGYENSPVSLYTIPDITTVEVPFRRMGELASKVLCDIMAGVEVRESGYVLRPEVLWRGSTR